MKRIACFLLAVVLLALTACASRNEKGVTEKMFSESLKSEEHNEGNTQEADSHVEKNETETEIVTEPATEQPHIEPTEPVEPIEPIVSPESIETEDPNEGDDTPDGVYNGYVVVLNDRVKSEIEKAFFDQKYPFPISWYETNGSSEENKYGFRCYYSENGITVLFEPTDLQAEHTINFDGVEFYYATSFTLWIFRDGQVKQAEEAYKNGEISIDALSTAAERHASLMSCLGSKSN